MYTLLLRYDTYSKNMYQSFDLQFIVPPPILRSISGHVMGTGKL